MPNGTIL